MERRHERSRGGYRKCVGVIGSVLASFAQSKQLETGGFSVFLGGNGVFFEFLVVFHEIS